MLSQYCSNIADQYGIIVVGVDKLVINLGKKNKYVFQYKRFQLDLLLGMKQTSIHRILKFKKSDWSKKHIERDTSEKKECC